MVNQGGASGLPLPRIPTASWNGALSPCTPPHPHHHLGSPRARRKKDFSGLNVCSASLLQTEVPDTEAFCSPRPLFHRLYLPLTVGTSCPYTHPMIQRLWATSGQGILTVRLTVHSAKPRPFILCGLLNISGLETGTLYSGSGRVTSA